MGGHTCAAFQDRSRPVRRLWNRADRMNGRITEKGEAIVEFALLAPILLLLLFGLVDFGRVFDAWLITTNAAREGARYATIYAGQDYLSDAQVRQLTKQKALDYLNSGLGGRSDVTLPTINDITVTIPSRLPGEPATVNVAVKVEIWALVNMFLSNPANLQGQATMRI